MALLTPMFAMDGRIEARIVWKRGKESGTDKINSSMERVHRLSQPNQIYSKYLNRALFLYPVANRYLNPLEKLIIMPLQLLEMGEGFSCYVSKGLESEVLDEKISSGEHEARNVYKEIFEEGCYEKPELSGDAPFIVDAGAHVGMFSMYMKRKYPSCRIAAFEPAPETFNALHRNLALHNVPGVVTYPFGLGTEAATATLTYYPIAHANTTFAPSEKEPMKKFLEAYIGRDSTEDVFRNIEIPVPVNRLSHFLDYYHSDVTRIDLLKVDVEGTELEVIGGLDDKHWEMVRNVVLEVSDVHGVLSTIDSFLQSKGFKVVCEIQDGPAEMKMNLVRGSRDPVETREK